MFHLQMLHNTVLYSYLHSMLYCPRVHIVLLSVPKGGTAYIVILCLCTYEEEGHEELGLTADNIFESLSMRMIMIGQTGDDYQLLR